MYDAAVLGAGAAGLFCAGLLRARGQRVVVVDHAPAAGRKILISGGGRANFTNLNTRPEHFLSENPHFAKSALAQYTPHQFVALVERYGIAYHEKAAGQLFCDGPARQIVDMLLTECAGVEVRLNTTVEQVDRAGDGFRLGLRAGGASVELRAKRVVVATGGLSIPKLGATGFGYDVARKFDLAVVAPRPALVPFTFAETKNPFRGLSGVATEVEATATVRTGRQQRAVRFRDKLLVTHRGLSGPAMLQISSYWQPGEPLMLDLAPGSDLFASLRRSPSGREEHAYLDALTVAMPRRLAERVATLERPASWTNASLQDAEARLHRWPITPDGTEGFEKAEVTGGGVATSALDASSMEAKNVPGLHFIGEVVDVTGHLGGFNFQWAWASASAAASAIAPAG